MTKRSNGSTLALETVRSQPASSGAVCDRSDRIPSADSIIEGMDVQVAYLEGCVGWRTARQRLEQALERLGWFTSGQAAPVAGQAFLHVPDAGRLWKQLRQRGVAGVGPVEDTIAGLREFVVTDPDGNRIRVGSPTPKD